MIHFEKSTLPNGLRLLVHEDRSTPLLAVNVLYAVGSRDESPERTGFAHLFEHLMFGGSLHCDDYDTVLQNAGGDSNAFTNTDITNFYCTLPAANIETALWLESDRMLGLSFSKRSLDVQRKVVIEEFKETCIDEPYGDVWHHLLALAFKQHPYRWPVIGREPSHIEQATLEEVKQFFHTYYRPNNAIVVIAGPIAPLQAYELVSKWFGDIPSGALPARALPVEPEQQELRRMVVEAEVPSAALYMAFRMPGRMHPDYLALDLLSDLLSSGQSSRFYRRLIKERELFTEVDAYMTGSVDPGLFIVDGQLAEGVDADVAESAIWAELQDLQEANIGEEEFVKLKNKAESALEFSECSVLNKAINLAFFELLGDAGRINEEAEGYRQVSIADLQRVAKHLFRPENCSVLRYKPLSISSLVG